MAYQVKRRLRTLIELALRRMPVSRSAYRQKDIFQALLLDLEAVLEQRRADQGTSPADRSAIPLSAEAQIGQFDPHQLEILMPIIRTLDERIDLACRCRDADSLPKVATAGMVFRAEDGTNVQIMHNGLKVRAGGYYGEWMQTLIARCKGHHEPQEEVLFAEILKFLDQDATMVELGGYWSYYSLWFMSQGAGRRSIVVEADPRHIETGKLNAMLNDCKPTFIHAFVGRQSAPPSPFETETSGTIALPCISVPDLLDGHAIGQLDLLHCDAQGVELEVLESCGNLAAFGRLSWIMVSTHTHHISADPLTHQRCLAVLRQSGATILAEHDVQESFSGDGLIVAKYGPVPAGWSNPKLTYNRYSESLFRNPLYDLALAAKPRSDSPSPIARATAWPGGTEYFAPKGNLLEIKSDCPLGAIGDVFLVPSDQVMFPYIVANGVWAPEALAFLEKTIQPGRQHVVLDIGANIGLFTRQLSLKFPQILKFICVEADQENFCALQYNLQKGLGKRCALWNMALSDVDGDNVFYRDRENIGNYSLNNDAMRGRPHDTITIRSAKADEWMRENVSLHPGERLVWKSDTQGYDELIVSLTPMDIWAKVDFAVIELWRIKKPRFDKDEFARRINMFSGKSIGAERPCTTDDVVDYLTGEDWSHEDLFLWHDAT